MINVSIAVDDDAVVSVSDVVVVLVACLFFLYGLLYSVVGVLKGDSHDDDGGGIVVTWFPAFVFRYSSPGLL